ncbi:MAG: serine/threonine-protein kinase, partial [Chloroflexota bacterium]
MAASDLTSFILGSYRLTEVLGMGAMGYVYRARQVNLERDVAVKVLSPHLAQEAGYIDLFMREARIAASLEHPHIVPVFDYGVQQDVSYVVMRLLPGGSLGDRIKHRIERQSPLPSLTEISLVLTQAASALDYAHERGVIHRDIKPNNLMFDQHGVVYIVDFGIAKMIGTTSSIKGSTFLGTPSFMAPEQWQGQPATPAVDQYALGAVVYMMVTGHPPFESEIALALLSKHLNETPKDVQLYRPSAPDQLNAVLQQSMAKKPEDRFLNNLAFAQAFAAAVRNVEEQPSTEFTAFMLPRTGFAMPFPTPVRMSASSPDTAPASSDGVRSPDGSTAPAAHSSSAGRRHDYLLWALGGIILVLALAILALFVSQQNALGDNLPTAVAGGVATATPSPTFTLEATQQALSGEILPVSQVDSTETPTDTASATLTPTFTLTLTHTPSATATATNTATPVPSLTPSDTPTSQPSDTLTFTATN